MTHPDGGVSFFNDSADGIAPTKAKIESYAEKLGFEVSLLILVNLKLLITPTVVIFVPQQLEQANI